MENHIKEKIVSVLRKNSQGLTITDISQLLGIHRTTVPKYLYELRGEKKVRIREIGIAKLFYLTKKVS